MTKLFTGRAAPSQPAEAERSRYQCAAHQCPMPGTVFLGGPQGVCGWHARESSNDWPTITQAILDWECVWKAIMRARRVLTADATCADGKAQAQCLAEEWAMVAQAVLGTGWKTRLEPKKGENLSEWSRRLNVFLGARVNERIKGSGVIDETKPTQFAAEVLEAVRKRQALRGGGPVVDDWGAE